MFMVWLDDKRTPPNIGWLWVKTQGEAINLLKSGVVGSISLDHDLGPEKTCGDGYKVVSWIEHEAATNPNWPIPHVFVHTANPAVRQKMMLVATRIDKLAGRS